MITVSTGLEKGKKSGISVGQGKTKFIIKRKSRKLKIPDVGVMVSCGENVWGNI